MKNLRSKIKNYTSPILHEDWSSPSRELRTSINSKESRYKNLANSCENLEEDCVVSDLERENQQNLEEAKKLIQKTKNIIQTTNQSSNNKNRSFEGGILKTSISQKAFGRSEGFSKVNSGNVSIEEVNKASEEPYTYGRMSMNDINR